MSTDRCERSWSTGRCDYERQEQEKAEGLRLTQGVVGLELTVVGLVGRVADGLPAHRESQLAPLVLELRSHLTVLKLRPSGPSHSHGTLFLPEHRGRKGRVIQHLGGVRLEGDDRRGLERDVADPLAVVVEEVHLRGIVLAVPDDALDGLAVADRVVDAPEGVVVEDHLDEAVERLYIGAIVSVISRSAVLFTVFCTKSAMGFAPLRHNAPGCA
jgi:hypothetical protein